MSGLRMAPLNLIMKKKHLKKTKRVLVSDISISMIRKGIGMTKS